MRETGSTVGPEVSGATLGAGVPPARSRPGRAPHRLPRDFPRHGVRWGPVLSALWPVLPLLAGSAIWLASLRSVALDDVGDVGLLPVLPAAYWVAVALLLVGTSVAIWRAKLQEGLVAAYAVALVVVLYGAAAAVSSYPRGIVPWRHVGIAQYIWATGGVEPRVDAYFNWPGYFSLLATYTGMSGLEDASALMKWAPVVNNLLFLAPMLIIARVLTRDRRLAWSACVLFVLGNWVDQDYLAPQALAFFFYLCVLALLLTVLRASDGGGPPTVLRLLPPRWRDPVTPHADGAGEPAEEPRHGERGRAVVVVVLITTAVVTAHQLTPFALLLALLVVAATRTSRVRGLVTLTALMVGAWLALPAATYMQGNVQGLLDQVGDLTGAAQGNLVERVQGSPGHLFVVNARLLFSATFWGVAAVAALRVGPRNGPLFTAMALAVVPGLLFPLQSYGGEMLLRIFLFSLPFTCMVIVAWLVPRVQWRTSGVPQTSARSFRRRAGTLFLVATLALAPASVLVRYGNQLIDQRSTAEVIAVRTLYDLAPAGSVLVAGNENTPWRGQEYADHRHLTITRLSRDEEVPDLRVLRRVLYSTLTESRPTGLLILTRQQRDYEKLLGRQLPWTVEDVEAALLSGDRFRVVFENEDAVILAPVLREEP